MNAVRRILLLLTLSLLAATTGVCQTQNVYLVNDDTVHIHCCRYTSGQVYSNQQFTECNQWVVIHTYGQPLELTIYSYYCRLTVNSEDSLIHYHENTYSQFDTLSVTSDRITIYLQKPSDDSYPSAHPYLALTWRCVGPPAVVCARPTNPHHFNNASATEADIYWTGTATDSVIVDCGPIHHVMTGSHAHLMGLEPNTRYLASIIAVADSEHSCCADTISFYTDYLPYTGNPNMTDLSTSYARCYYGTFQNPYLNTGRIDYGPDELNSRHTVHTDTAETDPRTGGLLHTVCPGTTASVRLGNAHTGAQAEAIAYKLHIDTLIYSILLLHYAAVLENPNHTPNIQPRFRLEILDSTDQMIDNVCGMADFIANSSLGWNVFGGTLWKDWTTVGFDLSPYHGQNITLRFTTYDCNAGGHYGYAYYSAECIRKSVASEQCGNVTHNIVTAPDGFYYQWYHNDPTIVLSTNRTYSYTTANTVFYCTLISKENANCRVTMSTYAGTRYPFAVADTLFSESHTCQGYTVAFIDRSVVVDESNQSTGDLCETSRWYFGDGDSSTLSSPQHTYYEPGDYTVMLVAGIANENCLDTSRINITVPDYTYHSVTRDIAACDSIKLEDSVWYNHDTTIVLRHYHPDVCDTMFTYRLSIHNTIRISDDADTFCYNRPYLWHGQTVGSDTITRLTGYLLTDSLRSVHGCDSVHTIHLVQLPRDNVDIIREPDCDNRSYRLTAQHDCQYLSWTSNPHDDALEAQTYNDTIYVNPEQNVVYVLTTDYRDSAFCPTVAAIVLHPVTFPKARLKITPEALTFNQLDFDAYNISLESIAHRWFLVFHPDGSDTLHLAEPSGHLHYTLTDSHTDTLEVLLVASNDICYDTARTMLPFLKVAPWAPNVFTPSEAENNRFTVNGLGLLEAELYIYDREGRLLFRTTDLVEGWDGTHDGQPCRQAAYVWHLRYRAVDFPNTWRSATGTVTLLR